MVYVFWIAFIFIFHAYFGYPISLSLFRLKGLKRVDKQYIYPQVSFIITVHNEEKTIEKKLKNTLSLDYPPKKLQVIVASDGSTDRTNNIVASYEKLGVQLLKQNNRRGKEHAQKKAVAIATGKIIVFSDASTELASNGLKEIVANFNDSTVGCVSSEDRVKQTNGSVVGEGLYVKYEMFLRRMESSVNSLVGLSGSLFAARKEVCENFSSEMQSDFRTLLNSMRLGLRGIVDPKAIGYYRDIADQRKEFERKIRTVLRGLAVFFNNLEFLNIFRYRLFAYQYFCHKLLRWLVPFFLLGAFFTNIVLVFTSKFFFISLLCQMVFYLIAMWGSFNSSKTSNIILRFPLYFSTVNTAIIVAWWRYLRGQRVVKWKPSER
jgi:cellulose synthase/poly-beta-1,6-N-acetylglucosamine synthase-like glycosyltransferase